MTMASAGRAARLRQSSRLPCNHTAAKGPRWSQRRSKHSRLLSATSNTNWRPSRSNSIVAAATSNSGTGANQTSESTTCSTVMGIHGKGSPHGRFDESRVCCETCRHENMLLHVLLLPIRWRHSALVEPCHAPPTSGFMKDIVSATNEERIRSAMGPAETNLIFTRLAYSSTTGTDVRTLRCQISAKRHREASASAYDESCVG